MRNKKFVNAVMVPSFIHMMIFIVVPIVIGLVISFYNYNPLSSTNSFVGFQNYSRLLSDENFKTAFINTFEFAFITVTLNIIMALFFATIISQFRSNAIRSFFRMVFFLFASPQWLQQQLCSTDQFIPQQLDCLI